MKMYQEEIERLEKELEDKEGSEYSLGVEIVAKIETYRKCQAHLEKREHTHQINLQCARDAHRKDLEAKKNTFKEYCSKAHIDQEFNHYNIMYEFNEIYDEVKNDSDT